MSRTFKDHEKKGKVAPAAKPPRKKPKRVNPSKLSTELVLERGWF